MNGPPPPPASQAPRVQLNFPVPVPVRRYTIVSNGTAGFSINTLARADPTLEQWMADNHPHANDFRVNFRVSLPFAGTVLPPNLQRGLDEAYEALAPLVKVGTTVVVKVSVPGKDNQFTPAEKEMLEQVLEYITEALWKPWKEKGPNEQPQIRDVSITGAK